MFNRELPVSGEVWRHFKERDYLILTIAKHTETDEELVIYRALYGNYAVYARPLGNFMDKIDNAKQKYRFEKLVQGD